MGEAWGGDRRSADARAPYQVHGDGDGGADTGPGGKRGGSGREGRLELSVPQVAGSAVAAVVAAKLASNLGVYGTIAGAGVVSVLGTCGGTILQHVFRRTGRRVQEVAVQARPGVLRVVNHAGRTRLDEAAVPEPGPDPAGTDVLPPAADPAGPFRDVNRTAALRGAGGAALFREDAGETAGGETAGESAPHAGYGEPTAYRARRRGWKRPVVAVALAFGLTMGGITAYEALAGENISGHGHGTTIGNALTGKSGSSHHDTPQRPTPPPPSTTPSPSTTPRHDTPTPRRTTPTTPPPTDSPTPPPTPSPPTPSPTPSLTPTDGATATTSP